MKSRIVPLAWVVLAGCGEGGPGTAAGSPAAVQLAPVRLSVEVAEGETVAIPVSYERRKVRRENEVTIGLDAAYGTASAEDVVFMPRVGVWQEDGVHTVEFGLLAVADRLVEGPETLVLRPGLGGDVAEAIVGTEALALQETEIEVVITDGPPPCAGVDVRPGAPRVLAELESLWGVEAVYAVEVVVDAPVRSEVFEWLAPADVAGPPGTTAGRRGTLGAGRTRTLSDWRIEMRDGRVRHHLTAQWSESWVRDRLPPGIERPTPLLDLQVCGGAGYGKFVRCSPTECAVHDEGL